MSYSRQHLMRSNLPDDFFPFSAMISMLVVFDFFQETVSHEGVGLLRGGDRARQSDRHHSTNPRLRRTILCQLQDFQVRLFCLISITFLREKSISLKSWV